MNGGSILHGSIGDLVFSDYFFGQSLDYKKLIQNLVKTPGKCKAEEIETLIDKLVHIKTIIPLFIDDCANKILSTDPKIFGFTSSYNQNCSSLLLAKKIKEKEDIPIIFGGSNSEGIMGFVMLKRFPQVDYVCSRGWRNCLLRICNASS